MIADELKAADHYKNVAVFYAAMLSLHASVADGARRMKESRRARAGRTLTPEAIANRQEISRTLRDFVASGQTILTFANNARDSIAASKTDNAPQFIAAADQLIEYMGTMQRGIVAARAAAVSELAEIADAQAQESRS